MDRRALRSWSIDKQVNAIHRTSKKRLIGIKFLPIIQSFLLVYSPSSLVCIEGNGTIEIWSSAIKRVYQVSTVLYIISFIN